jgi:hypothetical protein
MDSRRVRLVRKLLVLRSRLVRSRPEQHYMRGPGPKTLGKLGEAYRDAAKEDLVKRIPKEWMMLVDSIKQREGDC